MGRPLAGPVRIGSSPTWYARLTVKPADRVRAGATRLCKSLGTTDRGIALQRWPEAYQKLKEELAERLSLPITQHHLLRARIESGNFRERLEPSGVEPIHPVEAVTLVTNQPFNEKNPQHVQVFNSLTTGKALLSWDDLFDIHSKRKKRISGRGLAASTQRKIKAELNKLKTICPDPQELRREHVLKYIEDMFYLDPVTVSARCGLVSAVINSGIKSDSLSVANPFGCVDFRAAQADENKRLDLSEELMRTVLKSKYGEIFRVLVGTGLRTGELFSRQPEHIEGMMLIVCDTPGFRVKTRSSVRRVPLDVQAKQTVLSMIERDLKPITWSTYLSAELRAITDDRRVVLHSCRHTFKTITRRVGIPIDISDEISGHAKRTTSVVSGAYGRYPDELLLSEADKVWNYLNRFTIT